MNIPNALSLLRILLVAPFLIAIIYHHYLLALTLFIMAGLSDALDGFLARRLGQKSILGTYLDPVGDHLLTTAAFVSLGFQGLLPAWLAVIVVAKDLYVALGAGILYFSGNLSVMEPSVMGKLTTLLQFITLGFTLFSSTNGFSALLLEGLFIGTGLVTVITCVQYMLRGIQAFANTRIRP